MISINLFKCVSSCTVFIDNICKTNSLSIDNYFHYFISLIRSDSECLVSAFGHHYFTGWINSAAFTSCCCYGMSFSLPYYSKRRETFARNIEFDTVGIEFHFHSFKFTGRYRFFNFSLTGYTVFTMEILVVQYFHIEFFIIIFSNSLWVRQIYCSSILSRYPCVTVKGIYQIEVVEVVSVCSTFFRSTEILCSFLFHKFLSVVVFFKEQTVVENLDSGSIFD